MSSVETGQMSAAETGQISAADTGQMSAAETEHLSCFTRRHLFQGGPGGSSLQPVNQITIFGARPGTQPALTGGSPRIWCQAPPTDPPDPRAKARMTAVKQTPSNDFGRSIDWLLLDSEADFGTIT